MADAIHPFTVREGLARNDDLKTVTKNLLGGAWDRIPHENISVTTIDAMMQEWLSFPAAQANDWLQSGGITNILFKMEGPRDEEAVLVRIYGEETEVLIDRERDNSLFSELAMMGYAPPYHGRFSNGRIEGFLPARPLQPHEMGERSPVDFVSMIAREMVRLHRLPVKSLGPVRQAEMWDTLSKWLDLAKGLTFADEAKTIAVEALDLPWVCKEAAWLRRQLCPPPNEESSTRGECDGPDQRAIRYLADVVLSHNDLLSGNVLYGNQWDRVQVIDFEYSGFNHRGFDIANHFCEHAGFDSNFAKSYPTAEIQDAFLLAYVRAAGDWDESGHASKGIKGVTEEREIVQALRTHVNKWALPSHLWWAAWAVVQTRYSPIDFDFADYARLRLAGYRLHKQTFFGETSADTPM